MSRGPDISNIPDRPWLASPRRATLPAGRGRKEPSMKLGRTALARAAAARLLAGHEQEKQDAR
jgi:hypothetical protein